MSNRHHGTAPGDDTEARERALDVGRSFLVQAPAGSGKTELLIQRFLALLAHVDRPEAIVATTFTRKAAGEMRERIIAALQEAAAGTAVASAHAQRTRELALAALARDAREEWQLIAHPARLAVFTIDAFAAGLARQAPLAARLGAAPRYEERAEPLYAQAARAALARATAGDSAWGRLLAHLDNDADRAVGLLADLLEKRDQWIGELRREDRGAFRAMLETTLAAEITGELGTAAALFPLPLVDALAAQERYAAANLAAQPETAELAAHLRVCAAAGGLPPTSVHGREHWLALAQWLLVGNDARIRVLARAGEGFPPKGSGDGAGDRLHRKRAMRSLLGELAAVPGLAGALDAVRRLPPPTYGDEAWTIIDALLDVLPRSAAELLLAFRDAGAIDFTQGTMAALEALGDEDAPSDLLLRLDLRIRHLLVDEFQDTSYAQLALLRKLTAGWQPGDGRTLFAVGDPMQSIYRFRGAEVRLFVEAQEMRRIVDVPLDNIVLRRNFRSQRGLVEWVDRAFPQVLGARSDPWRGAVAFAPAVAVHDSLPGHAVTVDFVGGAEDEARVVVGHVRAALAEGAGDVAVLVRARAHLDALLPALRAAGIPFAAVELEALAERQAVLDLVSLTHALVQPADRLAWLAVLRAPWCGLALPDLFAVAAAADAQGGSIARLVLGGRPVAGLTAEGAARYARIAQVLAPALAARGRTGLTARVRGAWLALGGPATLEEPLDLDAAERCFALLDDHAVAGDVPEWPAFVDALGRLYATPEAGEAARVQVMTLHKAKGLEFDTVILPGLARKPGQGRAEILRWRRRPSGLMLAPMKARGGGDDPIYAYLTFLDGAEESAELGRLLYVGCTRAKRRLHLTAVLVAREEADGTARWAAPPSASALAKFRDIVGGDHPAGAATIGAATASAVRRRLARLPLGWTPALPGIAVPVATAPAPAGETPPFDWARATAKHVGTVAHRVFAQIAREGAATWDATRVSSLAPRIRAELAAEGVDDSELAAAATSVATIVGRLLGDERGRWLLDPAHAEARSEWALAGWDGERVAHVVLDRTFVADGVRWIVDFKTGAHEGADVDTFLDREVERYRGQLDRYARFVRALDDRPIRLGIFHPLLGGWREWPFVG